MKATHRIMDSVWTLEYRLEPDDTLTILSYDRDDPEGHEKERELPQVRLVEESGRVVTAVLLWEKYSPFRATDGTVPDFAYTVANPGRIFSWPYRQKGISG